MQIEQLLHEDHLDSLPTAADVSLLAASSAVYVLHQDLTYDYTAPIRDVRQRLMVVPREVHGDQRRIAHHLKVTAADAERSAGVSDGRSTVRERMDEFGNSVVHVDAPTVHRSIHFRVRAVVRRTVADGASVAHGVSGTASTAAFDAAAWADPRSTVTRLTTADEAIRDAAGALRGGDVQDLTQRICSHVRSEFTYGHGVTGVRTTAAEAWAGRVGVCQDMAHVMIAMCSTLGVAARYVSGHLVGDGASHAWVEVYDPRHRQVIAIDPTHDRRTDLRYVTTAVGRDYGDVAPTSGTFRSSGAHGTLRVRKRIRLADVA